MKCWDRKLNVLAGVSLVLAIVLLWCCWLPLFTDNEGHNYHDFAGYLHKIEYSDTDEISLWDIYMISSAWFDEGGAERNSKQKTDIFTLSSIFVVFTAITCIGIIACCLAKVGKGVMYGAICVLLFVVITKWKFGTLREVSPEVSSTGYGFYLFIVVSLCLIIFGKWLDSEKKAWN